MTMNDEQLRRAEDAGERLERALERMTGEVPLGSRPRESGGVQALRTVEIQPDGTVVIRVGRKLPEVLALIAAGVEAVVAAADAAFGRTRDGR